MTAAPAKKAAKKRGRNTGKKLGWAGYASVLRSIKAAPQTAQQLAERFGIGIQSMRRVVTRFHDLGMLHRCGWQKGGLRGPCVPVYGYGPGTDATPPEGHRAADRPASRGMSELVQVVHILRRLEQEPIGKVALAAAVGSSPMRVALFVDHCHRIGLVRIADWSLRLRGGRPGALYGLGTGADAPRPARVPRSVIQRRNRAARRERQSTLHMIGLTARPLAGQQAQGASA